MSGSDPVSRNSIPRSQPRSVVVLTTPRSGSSWTASLMRGTGVLGECREWFTWLLFEGHARNFPAPAPARTPEAARGFVDAMRAAASTPNGVSAVKVISSMWDALPARMADWGIGDGRSAAWFGEVFPRPTVLVLRRRDRIAQAISWWRAQRTLEFARFVGDDGPRTMPEYDLPALVRALAETDGHAEALERAVAAARAVEGATIVERTYEDMLGEPGEAVRAIAAAAGIALPEGHCFESELEVQRDAATMAIRARFEEDLARAHDSGDGSAAADGGRATPTAERGTRRSALGGWITRIMNGADAR